ncbi:autoinducer binding domain-containing protein [Trinickia mobilis]|uniref:autoinducer binding domain-containing protein n=1 Tax=Trinickia mobilis TaxID=2816356 RepID=UPI001A8FEC01|nr:autoinducer binding domain-containing protein [Trinickia mobilis]
MLERDLRSLGNRLGDVRVTQVVLACKRSLQGFLRAEPYSRVIEPAVHKMIESATNRMPQQISSRELHGRDAIHSAIREISRVPDESELIANVRAITRAMGASTAFFFLCERSAEGEIAAYRILIASPDDTAAAQTYVAKRWYATDPFLMHAGKSQRPYFSSDVGFLENLTGSWRDMGEFARAVGMRSWIVAPAHLPRASKFGVLYASNSTLPADHGEEPLRENRVFFGALSAELLDWYISRDKALALKRSALSTLEIQILDATARGQTLDQIALSLDLSETALRERISASIRSKLAAKNIIEAARLADEMGLLAAGSERKVAYVVHSPRWGTFLGEILGVPFWSNVNPEGLERAAIFADVLTAREVLDSQLPGHDCVLHRVDVHHAAQTASIDDCVAAGLPGWAPGCTNSGAPADDSGTVGVLGAPPATYH